MAVLSAGRGVGYVGGYTEVTFEGLLNYRPWDKGPGELYIHENSTTVYTRYKNARYKNIFDTRIFLSISLSHHIYSYIGITLLGSHFRIR